MGGGGGEKEEDNDLYAVVGLEKECSSTDLKTAYRKLAKKWHPDRCAASGNSTLVEEAKKKFQDIQGAYSVLSNENKRLLYDLGIYDGDDDENNNGMGDFLNEMVATMSQIKPASDNGEDSFREFQELFDEIIRPDNTIASASTSTSQVPTPSSYMYSRSYSVASSSSSSPRSSFSTTTSFSHILSGRVSVRTSKEQWGKQETQVAAAANRHHGMAGDGGCHPLMSTLHPMTCPGTGKSSHDELSSLRDETQLNAQ